VTPPPVRTLWLLRHAKAVADPPPGGGDFDRVLAPRGRRDAQALGHLVGQPQPGTGSGPGGEPPPQIALVSPAARTMATADLVLAGVTPPPRRLAPANLYGGEPEDVLRHLRSLDDGVRSAMVVGHNPTAHALALGLLELDDKDGRDVVVRRGFPTCALGIYRLEIARWADVEGQCAVLSALLIPPFDKG
jgi:phosphohistidine phosphatase